MAREPSVRMRRVNEAIKELVSGAVANRLKDPRIGFVTVTGANATSDLQYATIYVSVFGKESEKEQTLEGLRSSEGFLQEIINRELHLKRTPKLEFVYDESIDEGMKIQSLLRQESERLGISLAEEPAEELDEDFENDPEGEA